MNNQKNAFSNMKKEIKALIEKYANVYSAFEQFQKGDNSLLPGGDQKTGVIAEYYAKCYIEYKYKIKATYAKSGESFDLCYTKTGTIIKVQVKGVSEHSKSRTIAPLNLINKERKPAFDDLFLIDLGKDFIPVAFYINSYKKIIKKADKDKTRLQGSKMKSIKDEKKQGSLLYDFSENKIEELLKAIY